MKKLKTTVESVNTVANLVSFSVYDMCELSSDLCVYYKQFGLTKEEALNLIEADEYLSSMFDTDSPNYEDKEVVNLNFSDEALSSMADEMVIAIQEYKVFTSDFKLIDITELAKQGVERIGIDSTEIMGDTMNELIELLDGYVDCGIISYVVESTHFQSYIEEDEYFKDYIVEAVSETDIVLTRKA